MTQPPVIPPREPEAEAPSNDEYLVDVSAFDLAKQELRRFKGAVGKSALAFLILVPTLLAAVYLWANWDPLGNLDRLPVALVNEDQPAPAGGDPAGQQVAGGTALVEALTTSPLLGWQTVSAEQADQGLEDGDFYGVLKIPSDFSARLSSPAGDDPQRASVSIQLNDANNYLAGVAFGTLGVDLQNEIDAAAQAAYADAAFAGYDVLTKGFGAAAEDADKLATTATKTRDGAKELSASLDNLEGNARDLKVSTGDLSKGVASLATGLEESSDAVAEAVDKLKALLPSGTDPATTTPATTPADETPDTTAETKAIQDAADKLKTAGTEATGKVGDVKTDAEQTAKDAAALRTQAATANEDGATVADETSAVAKEAQSLADGLQESSGALPTGSGESREQLADVLVHPVAVKVTTLNPAGAYGRGMAPLFLAIGLWAFALIVFLVMRPVADDALESEASSFGLALGAWLPAALVGTAGAVVLVLAGALLGLSPDSPVPAFLLLLLGTWSFTAIVQALRLAFGPGGLAAGLFLLVIQVAASGGVYPVELGPGILEAISPLLPMTWLVDAFRVTISGGVGADVTFAAVGLIVLAVIALGVSTFAVGRKRGDGVAHPAAAPQR